MENFRPPAMEEVETQKRKKKALNISLISFILLVVGIGSFIGIKHLRIYLNYLAVEKKHQLLSTYYQALISDDLDTLQLIAPEVILTNDYNFIISGGDYSLFVFPDVNKESNTARFVIIDNSSVPSIPHLKQVTYGKNTDNDIIIKEIIELGTGSQID